MTIGNTGQQDQKPVQVPGLTAGVSTMPPHAREVGSVAAMSNMDVPVEETGPVTRAGSKIIISVADNDGTREDGSTPRAPTYEHTDGVMHAIDTDEGEKYIVVAGRDSLQVLRVGDVVEPAVVSPSEGAENYLAQNGDSRGLIGTNLRFATLGDRTIIVNTTVPTGVLDGVDYDITATFATYADMVSTQGVVGSYYKVEADEEADGVTTYYQFTGSDSPDTTASTRATARFPDWQITDGEPWGSRGRHPFSLNTAWTNTDAGGLSGGFKVMCARTRLSETGCDYTTATRVLAASSGTPFSGVEANEWVEITAQDTGGATRFTLTDNTTGTATGTAVSQTYDVAPGWYRVESVNGGGASVTLESGQAGLPTAATVSGVTVDRIGREFEARLPREPLAREFSDLASMFLGDIDNVPDNVGLKKASSQQTADGTFAAPGGVSLFISQADDLYADRPGSERVLYFTLISPYGGEQSEIVWTRDPAATTIPSGGTATSTLVNFSLADTASVTLKKETLASVGIAFIQETLDLTGNTAAYTSATKTLSTIGTGSVSGDGASDFVYINDLVNLDGRINVVETDSGTDTFTLSALPGNDLPSGNLSSQSISFSYPKPFYLPMAIHTAGTGPEITVDTDEDIRDLWRAVPPPGGPASILDPDRMPVEMVLDQRSDDAGDPSQFIIRQINWGSRTVGDITNNRAPRLFRDGNKIGAVAFHRGRLCLMGGDQLAMSEAEEYGNFFRTNVSAVLDSDRISLTASGQRKCNILNAAQTDDALLLFTDGRAQFRLTSTGPLSPASAELRQIMRYDTPDVAPVELGFLIHFVTEHNSAPSKMRQFRFYEEFSANDAQDVSGHYRGDMPNDIQSMAGFLNNGMTILLEKQSGKVGGTTMHVHRMSYNGDRLVQSAWFPWDLAHGRHISDILSMDGNLYMLTSDSSGENAYIEGVPFDAESGFKGEVVIDDTGITVPTDPPNESGGIPWTIPPMPPYAVVFTDFTVNEDLGGG